MSRIHDLIAAGPTLSFEFFPPRTIEGEAALASTIERLAKLSPSFVSVTYGAGGSTRSHTRDLVVGLCAGQSFPAMAHLTCVSHTRAEMEDLLDDYSRHDVVNILALAGDPPTDGDTPAGDFRFALELVELCRSRGVGSIGVAAFPESHPRSASRADDRRFLAEKLAAADFAITQFFFDAEDYSRMLDDVASLGVDKPIVPGVIPVTNPASVRRFSAMNGTRVPEPLFARLESADADDRLAIAVEQTVELCEALQRAGAPGLHFYALNQAEASERVVEALGLR